MLFELGALHDRLGNADSAISCFRQANRLVPGVPAAGDYETNKQIVEIRRLSTTCDRRWYATWSQSEFQGDGRRCPVFVMGFPRSGNTLLDQMLDCHPELETHQEVPALWHVAERVNRMPGGYPHALATLGGAAVAALREEYFQVQLQAGQLSAERRLVDTNPLATIHIPLIQRLFPESAIVFTVRHPLDVCLSCFMHDFKLNDAMALFADLEDTARFYHDVMSLREQYDEVFGPRHRVVRYEDLIERAETELRNLCEFLQLVWDPAMLDFDVRARRRGRINTPSYAQVTEPIYRRARFRWSRYERHLSTAAEILSPWIKRWGFA